MRRARPRPGPAPPPPALHGGSPEPGWGRGACPSTPEGLPGPGSLPSQEADPGREGGSRCPRGADQGGVPPFLRACRGGGPSTPEGPTGGPTVPLPACRSLGRARRPRGDPTAAGRTRGQASSGAHTCGRRGCRSAEPGGGAGGGARRPLTCPRPLAVRGGAAVGGAGLGRGGGGARGEPGDPGGGGLRRGEGPGRTLPGSSAPASHGATEAPRPAWLLPMKIRIMFFFHWLINSIAEYLNITDRAKVPLRNRPSPVVLPAKGDTAVSCDHPSPRRASPTDARADGL